jgi:hypothetical protein
VAAVTIGLAVGISVVGTILFVVVAFFIVRRCVVPVRRVAPGDPQRNRKPLAWDDFDAVSPAPASATAMTETPVVKTEPADDRSEKRTKKKKRPHANKLDTTLKEAQPPPTDVASSAAAGQTSPPGPEPGSPAMSAIDARTGDPSASTALTRGTLVVGNAPIPFDSVQVPPAFSLSYTDASLQRSRRSRLARAGSSIASPDRTLGNGTAPPLPLASSSSQLPSYFSFRYTGAEQQRGAHDIAVPMPH